jgi:hypothetical protein
MTLDQLGAKMRCDKCGKRPERVFNPSRKDTNWGKRKLKRDE